MKVFALPAGEDWVCDRFVAEWRKYQPEVSTDDPRKADVLWLLAGWCWNHIPQQLLQQKKVVVTVHHIDPQKFDDQQLQEFKYRDQFVDWYHVPCGRSAQMVRQLTSKPIFINPFWVNSRIWKSLDMGECRQKHGLSPDKFLIGSFQRDTEGHDLSTPKLAKGPDVFADVVASIAKSKEYDVEVVLAGWRRQYVMARLDATKVPYKYFERPSFEVINELYNSLNLYVVGSRYEGGPQSVFECAATMTPIISTPVGAAETILGGLDKGHIFEISDNGKYSKVVDMLKKLDVHSNYERVMDNFLPRGMEPFVRWFGRMKTT